MVPRKEEREGKNARAGRRFHPLKRVRHAWIQGFEDNG